MSKVWRNVPIAEILRDIIEQQFWQSATGMVRSPLPESPISPLDMPEDLSAMFQQDHRHFFYLIGPPGVGKTTVLDRALELADLDLEYPPGRYSHRLIHRSVKARQPEASPLNTNMSGRHPGVYLGKRREAMSGTDALAMNAITGVIDELVRHRPPLVIGEGDRLANDRMFSTMQDLGYENHIYFLSAPPPTLTKRLRTRGSDQNAAWQKGRVTKHRKLAVAWRAMRLNGTMPVDHNAAIIGAAITEKMSTRLEQEQ